MNEMECFTVICNTFENVVVLDKYFMHEKDTIWNQSRYQVFLSVEHVNPPYTSPPRLFFDSSVMLVKGYIGLIRRYRLVSKIYINYLIS